MSATNPLQSILEKAYNGKRIELAVIPPEHRTHIVGPAIYIDGIECCALCGKRLEPFDFVGLGVLFGCPDDEHQKGKVA